MPDDEGLPDGFWGDHARESALEALAKRTYQEDDGGRCEDCGFCTCRGADHPYCELTELRVCPETGGCDVAECDGADY